MNIDTQSPEVLQRLEEIDNYLRAIRKEVGKDIYSTNALKGAATLDTLKELPAKEIKQLCYDLLGYSYFRILEVQDYQEYRWQDKKYTKKRERLEREVRTAPIFMSALMRKNLNYTEEEWSSFFLFFQEIYKRLGQQKIYFNISEFPFNYAIQQIERYLKKNAPSKSLLDLLIKMSNWKAFASTGRGWGTDFNKVRARLNKIIQDHKGVKQFTLNSEDIGAAVNAITSKITKNQNELNKVLALVSTVSGGKPSAKFSKATKEGIALIGKDTYRAIAQKIIALAIEVPIQEISKQVSWGDYTEMSYLTDTAKQFIKGMVWTMESFSDRESIRLLGKLLDKAYAKIPGHGPAAAAIGNACAYTLGNMRGKGGLGELSRIKLRLKQNNIKKVIDKYLTEGAEKYNVSVEELKEMAVPDYGLEEGKKTSAFEDYQLQISIQNSKVNQQWFTSDGATMKSVPALVKKSTALTQKLKALRKEIKEIQKTYSAQKLRVDNQFILNRTWDFPSFEKYYLRHGLVSALAQKMIWTFSKGTQKASAILVNDQWQNVEGETIDWIKQDCEVQLWHPVFADEKEIVAWRKTMMTLEWKQPIKQAFRELYILTDAEVNTKNYSNRMAAHILKQHQFKTLAVLRDWKFALMGCYDDGVYNQTAEKKLPEHGITAEYWIDELNDYDAYNDAGIWLYIATDQVKFKRTTDDEIIDLIDVPPVVFSEIMRDVDLFVGVCSVGNDPAWQDGDGVRENHRDYWNSYSFGDLTEIAKTRKSILEGLLPRLTKIRDKAKIDGKFLTVKGDLRTYKIHIGSGNILMEPNDQYLCIVPARSDATDKLFIPFEGDRGLSIVLSKAFLLAEDTKITDPTIISQIKRTS